MYMIFLQSEGGHTAGFGAPLRNKRAKTSETERVIGCRCRLNYPTTGFVAFLVLSTPAPSDLSIAGIGLRPPTEKDLIRTALIPVSPPPPLPINSHPTSVCPI